MARSKLETEADDARIAAYDRNRALHQHHLEQHAKTGDYFHEQMAGSLANQNFDPAEMEHLRRKRAYEKENESNNNSTKSSLSDAENNGRPDFIRGDNTKDIGKQERAGWENNANRALGNALDNKKNNSGENFFGRHKKGIAGWIIGLVMGGGMFGIGTVLSGPAQWVQVMNFINDAKLWVNNAQTGARYLHNLKTLAKWATDDGISDNIQNSRLGIVGSRLAKTSIKRMEDQGMTFDKRMSGNAPSVTIDTTKEYGDRFNQDAKGGSVSDNVKKKRLEILSKRYGVSTDMFELSSDGKVKINFDKLSYTNARRFVNNVNGVGKFNVIGQVQTRMALKKVGKLSWLHPIRKLEQKLADKFADWLKDRMDKIAKNGFSSADEAAQAAAKKAKTLAEEAGKSAEEAQKAATAAAKAAKEGWEKAVKEAAEDISTKIIKFAIQKTGGKVTVASVKAAIPIVGWVMLAIQAYCMVVGLDDGVGAEKYSKVVTVAEGDTAETLGTGSQVMSGHGQDEDIDMTQLGNATKLKLFNPDVEEISPTSSADGKENTGYKNVGTTESSWWNAAPVKAALGEEYGTSELNDVPPALNDVTNPGLSFGGNKDMQNIWNIFSSAIEYAGGGPIGAVMKSLGMPTPMDAVCYVFDAIDDFIGGILTWMLTTSGLMNLLMQIPFMDALGNLMSNLMGWLRGEPLNIATATPQQFGSINMYGGLFMSNEQMLAIGGKALSTSEQLSLEMDQKRFLAEQQAQKPILSRLFDPTDYNSTIAQIGRAVNIDTSDQSIGTQLKNVGKMFASAPKLFGFAFNKISGNANAAVDYDYHAPMIAFSKNDMDAITGGNSGYDLEPNTNKAFSLIDSGSVTNDKMKKCFGVQVGGAPTYSVTQLDNQNGDVWNYGDNVGENLSAAQDNGCLSNDMLTIRTYLMDYSSLMASDCYENDGWNGGESADSCTEMGFGASGSSSAASSPSIDGAAPPEDYTRQEYKGKTFDVRTVSMLKAAETYAKQDGLTKEISYSQGSYNAGVSASAGTHDNGGAVDVSVRNLEMGEIDKFVKALRQAGFAAWYRDGSDGFPNNEHIHGIAIGTSGAGAVNPTAASQIVSYFEGKNGLKGNGADRHLQTIGRPIPTWAEKYGSRYP